MHLAGLVELEDREPGAWVAVLGFADRPAVDEQHAAVGVDPGLVGVAEHERPGCLGAGEPLVQARGLVLEQVLVDLPRRPVHEMHLLIAELEAQIERQRAHEVL